MKDTLTSELSGPVCDIETRAVVKPLPPKCFNDTVPEAEARGTSDRTVAVIDEAARLKRLGSEFFMPGVTG
jgi:hypothetical protein